MEKKKRCSVKILSKKRGATKMKRMLTLLLIATLLVAWANIALAAVGDWIIIEDNDYTKMTYTGSWETPANNSYYEPNGGTIHYSSASDNTFSFSYYGTDFKLIGRKGIGQGAINVTIDNNVAIPVSTDDGLAVRGLQTLYQSSGLNNNWHTVVVKTTSTSPVGFDKATYCSGGDAPTIVTFQEDNSRVSFTGNWSTASNPSYEGTGNSSKYANVANNTFSFTYYGTNFRIIGRQGPDYGQFKLQIDEASPVTVSTYASSYAGQRILYESVNLPEGLHIIKGTTIEAKAFFFDRATYNSFGKYPITYTYQDYYETAIKYLGLNWATYGNCHMTNTTDTNSYASFDFYGNQVNFYSTQRPAGGDTSILIDGGNAKTISQYNVNGAFDNILQATSMGLNDQQHTLTFKRTNVTDNLKYTTVDYITVTKAYSTIPSHYNIQNIIFDKGVIPSAFTAGSSLNCYIIADNYSGVTKNSKLIFGLYKDTQLIDVNIQDVSIPSTTAVSEGLNYGQTIQKSYTLPAKYDNAQSGYKIVAYLWEDIVAAKPLCTQTFITK